MASVATARQQWLDFGSGDHYDLVHGRHDQSVAVCTQTVDDSAWTQAVLSRELARLRVVTLAEAHEHHVYMGMAGLHGKRRTIANVAVLPACYVDLDFYRLPALAALDADALLDRIVAAHPWLPLPTLLVASGRGAYLQWVFSHPVPVVRLADWQAVEDSLIALLEPFGADPAARDAARVLRPAGSVNLKNDAIVAARRVGPVLDFARLERAVLGGMVELERATPRAPVLVHSAEPFELRPPRVSTATAAQRAQYLRPYQLAQARLEDFATLARLRGSPRLHDCRKRLLYAHAVALTWFVSDPRQVREELQAFAAEHFAGRVNLRRVDTVIKRLEGHLRGVVLIWNHQAVDYRYRHSNRYLIALLGITPEEQTQLRTIIAPAERQRRRVDRRRRAGMVPRDTLIAESLVRRACAHSLRSQGMTQREIAAALGISQQHVSRLLRHDPVLMERPSLPGIVDD